MEKQAGTNAIRYLIIHNHHEYGASAYFFEVTGIVDDLAEAFLSAVKDFYASSEGVNFPREICGNFGWNNVIASIPENIWENHGLKPFDGDEYCVLDFDDIDGETITKDIEE